MNKDQKTLLVWDADNSPPEGPWTRVLWRDFSETHECDTISIPKLVEEHADSLRKKYLEWIYELGVMIIKDKRLVDHLVVDKGFSYWWMSLFVEKSPYKSPITDAIKLFEFEELLKGTKPEEVRFVSTNQILNKSISILCENLGIAYRFRPGVIKKKIDLRGIIQRTPSPVKGIFSLIRHVTSRWSLRGVRVKDWFQGDRSIFLCSYFIHLDQKSCSKGIFYSRHWEVLPTLLNKKGFHCNWIQHFMTSSVVPNTTVANRWLRRFNREPKVQGFHQFLDSFLSWRIVFRVFKGWLKLLNTRLHLCPVRYLFQPASSNIDFWPLMKRDWYASITGSVAIRNLFWIELFDAAMSEMPPQRIGFYLCEHQGWERALIHAWRKHGHGKLYGVVHATVRFWDLRHFTDCRVFTEQRRYSLPQPDKIILNGKAAIDAYIQAGYPIENILEGEALRFLYLLDLKEKEKKTSVFPLSILVLGGIMTDATRKMLELLDSAFPRLKDRFNFTYKPHPNCKVRAEEYPRLDLTLATDPLGKIIQDYDIAFTCNNTSAGVDAYLAGMPVLVMLDQNELNMSPLYGHNGVKFVSTPDELVRGFELAIKRLRNETNKNDFFFLNPKLPMWKELLNE